MAEPSQQDLFPAPPLPAGEAPGAPPPHAPLAARMRPRRLAEIAGQEHLLQAEALLPRLVASDRLGSLLLWGPPGCGKTSLAEAIAAETRSRFVRVNAVLSNTAELREILSVARAHPERRTILFIDEIHRFNKAQQDLLLPDVEAGHVRLIGATTHNPGFYVNAPLLSRSHLFRLLPVPPAAVAAILARALADSERGLGARRCRASAKVLADLASLCDGDLRRALNALEVLVLALPEDAELGEADLEAFARERRIRYDADEDEHYDTASAFIKSMRGGDPDAALYWMGKMLAGGEDPRFIARRMVILASEDIGLADSRALPLAVSVHQACELVGLPECEHALVHGVLFLSTCPKSNSVATSLAAMHQAIGGQPLQAVPAAIRDGHGQAARRVGQGQGYLYSHEFPEAISGQDYLERPLRLYEPRLAGSEGAIAERLARWRELKARIRADEAESRGG